MKKIAITILAVGAIVVACKSKKTMNSSKEAVTDAQLTAVQSRFPDATKAELEKGYAVYTGPCTRCHGTKDVTAYTEPKLLEIVDAMSKKAKITPEEKQALVRFAVGVRATK
jgi:cytochrome c5